MEGKRIRISDIADELGLSTATVSNVLHGKAGKASPETVRRVQALLEKKQYIPSMAGILLAQNDSRIIGVVVNDHEKYEGRVLEDVFIAAAINHLSTEIENTGQFMMVKKTRDRETIIRFASMWNLEGLVLIGYCNADYAYLRGHMRVPFVVYDGVCAPTAGVCNITIDNFNGGFQVGRLLRRLGNESALCIADNAAGVDDQRYAGFCAGFGAGAERLLVPMQRAQRWAFYDRHWEILRSCHGLFAVSDAYAVELMQFLMRRGMRIPEDVSIVGFDDAPVCRMVLPTLTTVRQDLGLRAQIAMERLRALKAGGETQAEVMLPVHLVERDSTRRT